MKYYVYMVRCRDGSLYTGYTTDAEARIKAHNAGKGAKYTRSRLPVALVYLEEYGCEHQARSRECAIKRLSRKQKQELITNEKEGQT